MGSSYIGHGQYVFMWQFLENDSLWKDLGSDIALKLDSLASNGTASYSHGQWSYTVRKLSVDAAIQSNDNTQNERDLRRILYNRKSGQRVVWWHHNGQGQRVTMDTDLMQRVMALPMLHSMWHQRGKYNYIVAKSDASTCNETNLNTHHHRVYTLKMVTRDVMDSGWTSKGIYDHGLRPIPHEG